MTPCLQHVWNDGACVRCGAQYHVALIEDPGLDRAFAAGGIVGVIDALRTLRLSAPVLSALDVCRSEIAIEASRPPVAGARS